MRRKILVIEDELSIRENLLELLEAEGFETIGAENGEEGIDLAKTQAPDLILCDVIMPELDGYGVLKAMQQDPITARTPFVFLTVKTTKADYLQALERGVHEYLTKPFTRVALLEMLNKRLALNVLS